MGTEQKVAVRTGASRGIDAALVRAYRDHTLFRARSEEEKREYVGASAIGDECLRAVQFNYAGVEPDEGRITGRLLRIFDTGHHFEDTKSRQEGSLAPEASRPVSMARRIAW